eukprot:353320-Chlamydomonas_euryale.AAC.4
MHAPCTSPAHQHRCSAARARRTPCIDLVRRRTGTRPHTRTTKAAPAAVDPLVATPEAAAAARATRPSAGCGSVRPAATQRWRLLTSRQCPKRNLFHHCLPSRSQAHPSWVRCL